MVNRSAWTTGRPSGLFRRRAGMIALVAVLTVGAVLCVAWLRDDPASPDYPLVLGLGLPAGLALGVGIAFVWDRYSGRIKTASDVEAATGWPVLGMIPALRPEGSASIADTARRLLVEREAYGHLAAGLVGMLRRSGARCLLVTSPTRKAGRTTIAAGLATSFAADGMLVVLISADARGGRVDQLLGLRPEPGLMEVLDGASTLESALQPSGVDRLRVLAAGTPSGRGVVGYNLDDLARLLDRLTMSVDLVVIEAPPVLGSLETVLLAQEVDLVLVAVDMRRGRQSDAALAVSYLGHVEDKLVGCVANDPGRRRYRRRLAAPAPAPESDRVGRAGLVSAVMRLRFRLRRTAGATADAVGGVAGSARRAAGSVRSGLLSVMQLRALRRHRWVGVIATAGAVVLVISAVSWLSGDDGPGTRRGTVQTSDTHAATSVPSGQAEVNAAVAECRSNWDAQSPPLEAAAASLQQWQVHIGAMNQLVAGKITLDQARAFWEQTRTQAAELVGRFFTADSTYSGGHYQCRRPDLARDADADLAAVSACRHDIAQRNEALHAARVAIGTWHHHVTDMNMLRAGKMSPTRAVQLWLKYWKQGVDELKKYRAELRQTSGQHC
jgi:Mrp family chromosome partitioning ATPase